MAFRHHESAQHSKDMLEPVPRTLLSTDSINPGPVRRAVPNVFIELSIINKMP